jgi:Protein of unknown function (DUF1064)
MAARGVTREVTRGVQGKAGGGAWLPISSLRLPKRNKFGAIKTVVDGITFDSKREAFHYGTLKQRETAGEIERLECHPKYELKVNGLLICKFKPDFRFFDKAQYRQRVVDVKSEPTAKKRDFVLTRKLFEAVQRQELEVWF